MSKWSYEKNCSGGGNNEAQCYVANRNNSWVDGEILHMKAIAESVSGPALVDDDPNYDAQDHSGHGDFSSVRIRTKNKGDWRYGRIEVRAKLPFGQGTWPAIWMLPTDWVYGGWPLSGEIDIMEAVNLRVDGESRLYGTLHYGGAGQGHVYSGDEYTFADGSNAADDFHVYAIEWEEGEIRWYVDQVHFATQRHSGWYSLNALDQSTAPFDQTFHLILNLAVGGDWAANVNRTGIDPGIFPQEMLVDYVRVYECSKDKNTGRGCATIDNSVVPNPGHSSPEKFSENSLFDESLNAQLQWYFWAESGDVNYQIVNVGGNHGQVAQFSYNTDRGIAYFQFSEPKNIQDFKNIEFDLQVIADPQGGTGDFIFRADCTYPCSSGDYPITHPGLNQWRHYSISLADLSRSGLQLSSVNTPFVIAPPSGSQLGVVVQVDNVKLSL